MKSWVALLPLRLINSISAEYDMDADLITAMVSVESGGEECAVRYEPHYKWLEDPEKWAALNHITVDTEVTNQKTSWGLMQVMGGVARELDHTTHLTKLCIPKVGLTLGIRKLKSLQRQYSKFEDAISAYNQGSPRADITGVYYNQSYVNEVMKRYNYLKAL